MKKTVNLMTALRAIGLSGCVQPKQEKKMKTLSSANSR